LLVRGVLPVATVFLTRALVDSLVAVTRHADRAGISHVFWLVGALAGTLLLGETLGAITKWVRTAQSELVQDHLSSLIHQQAVTLDLSLYESPTYYDRLHQARLDAFNQPLALVENLGSLLQNGLTLLLMGGVLLRFGWWVPPVLLLSSLPAFAVVLRFVLRQNEWRLRSTPARRRTAYYDSVLTDRAAAAELRLFNLGPYFRDAFQLLRRQLRGEQIELARHQVRAELLAGAIGLLTMGFTMAVVLWRAMQGSVTLGEVALFYQAFSQGQTLMRTLLENAGQIYSNTLFLENLFAFLDLKSAVADPATPLAAPPLVDAIRFDRVTFLYPHSARPALNNFSMTVRTGSIVALVGENGAGKSTLLKLLCRLYDPQQGAVTLDGVDVRDLLQADLRRLITVLFQEPVQYQATASENIALGDLKSSSTRAAIREAARQAGADVPIEKLPQAYDALLGRKFGGAELSTGEWQRIALARAFLRQSPIMILDEPTSAMDSWAEADWMSRLRQLIAGRTALIVTHRFTTAMQADVIHVMADGAIVESGSHEELMTQGGRYAQSWRQQMRDQYAGAARVP
jgi:ATP-binding cassette, subfamily B, bacterial